jgi:hypothetical protein
VGFEASGDFDCGGWSSVMGEEQDEAQMAPPCPLNTRRNDDVRWLVAEI